MRKLLLGTTALAAAATLTANAALADVTISGGAEFKYLSRSSNNSTLDGTTMSSDNTMTIKFTQKTDSGLDLTYMVDFNADPGDDGNFGVDEKNPEPKLIKKRKRGIIYSVNSWDGYFYNHTNENAEDFKIDRCEDLSNQNWETYISAKDEVLIGGLVFLNNWVIRSETSNALGRLFVKDKNTNKEEELIFSDEKVIVPGVSLIQKDKKRKKEKTINSLHKLDLSKPIKLHQIPKAKRQ